MVPKEEGIFTNSSHQVTEKKDSAKAFPEQDEDERSRQQPSPHIFEDKIDPTLIIDEIKEKKDTVFLTQNIEEDFDDEQDDDGVQ